MADAKVEFIGQDKGLMAQVDALQGRLEGLAADPNITKNLNGLSTQLDKISKIAAKTFKTQTEEKFLKVAVANTGNMLTALEKAAAKARDLENGVEGVADATKKAQANATSLGGAFNVMLGNLATEVVKKGFDFLSDSVSVYRQELENTLVTQQLLQATDFTAGYSADALDALANQLAAITLNSGKSEKSMLKLLLTFDEVRGDEFKRVAAAANDLSRVFGTDLNTAATQLGQALQEPINATNLLRSAGIKLSEAQKEEIENLTALGDIRGAQNIILTELESRVGGAAAAHDKLSISQNNLENSIEGIKSKMGEWTSGVLTDTISYVEDLAALLTSTANFPFIDTMIAGFTDLGSIIVGIVDGLGQIASNAKDNAGAAIGNAAAALSGNENLEADYVGLLDGVGEAYQNGADDFHDSMESLTGAEDRLAEQALETAAAFAEAKDKITGYRAGEGDRNGPLPGADLDTGEWGRTLNQFSTTLGKTINDAFTKANVKDAVQSPVLKEFNKAFKFLEKYGNKDPKEEKEKKEEKSGGLTGITELYTKIQQAASKSPESKDIKRTADATAQAAETNAAIATHTKETVSNLGVLIGKLSNMTATFSK